MPAPEDPHFSPSALRELEQPLPLADFWPAQSGEGAHKYCAYNQTRKRFLGADVEGADFAPAVLADRIPILAPGSGLALWMIPFRGISPKIVRDPLDLLYLDANWVVLEAVESFPLAQVDPSSKPAASGLILPAQTIVSSRTRRGDQLILAAPEEVKRYLRMQQAAHAEQNFPTLAHPAAFPAIQNARALAPAQLKPREPKNWLQRLLSADPPPPPNPRQAPREVLPWVAAYFFNGGAPVAHAIRNMSVAGLYLLTEERWSAGTILRITLTDRREPSVERSITVNAKVVRWGNDGVGLQFLYTDGKARRPSQIPQIEDCLGGVNQAQVEHFLERVRSSVL